MFTQKQFENKTLTVPIFEKLLALQAITPFDSDGFELTPLEQSYYFYSDIRLETHLNKYCCHREWLADDSRVAVDNVYVDHALLLERYSFGGEAEKQLQELYNNSTIDRRLQIIKMLNTKPKWGIDLHLEYFDGKQRPFDLIHVEFDSRDINKANDYKQMLEHVIPKFDWNDIGKQFWLKREDWQYLQGFEQNVWKAKFFGFPTAELTEKVF